MPPLASFHTNTEQTFQLRTVATADTPAAAEDSNLTKETTKSKL